MKKKIRAAWLFACILAVVAVIFTGYKSVKTYRDYHKSESLYDEAIATYVATTAIDESDVDENENNAEGNTADTEAEDSYKWYDLVNVDLEGIQDINSDVVGWIYFENEDISYPILYSDNNDEYIRTSYTGENMTAGSIFMECTCSPDFSDSHTIIYGHNMKDLSMFGRLRYYKQDVKYYDDHKYFQVITNDSVYRYMIFAYSEVTGNSDIYMTRFTNTKYFRSFVKRTIIEGSYINAGIDVAADDRVITLSTCTKGDNRFVVSALRVDEHSRK